MKTVQVDGKQLAKLRRLLRVKTDEEALQIAIDQTLAAEDAIEAARKLRERGTFGRSWDIVSPEPDDFYLVGQMLSYYSRRYGHIEPRDHTNDALIAVCASRAEAKLITVNAEQMRQWQRILSRFKKRLDLEVLRV